MAIIYTYGFDNNVQDNDAWIGTNATNRKTKQFTVASVANYLNNAGRIAVGGQMTFKFVTSGANNGTISFPGGGGNGTNFTDIASLYVSIIDTSGANVTEWLNYLVGQELLLSEQNEPNNFGHYRITSYTVDTNPNFYTLVLTDIGGYGTITADTYYNLNNINLVTGTTDPTGLEAINEGNGIGWRLIGRDADNYGNIGEGAIDFSNSDSISTERGSVGTSAITFGYNNINQQTGTFMIGSLNNAEITDIYQGQNFITGYDIDVYGAVYNSFIGIYRGTVGVQGTNYVTNAIYQSLVVGDGANFYAGRDAGAVGGGLISGSTGVFTVGIANEDLTTTTSNYLTSQYNNYGPRFIVGCGTYNPVSQVATRANGFVVMSDGTATFPILTNALIDAAGDDSAVTKGWVNSGPALTSEQVRIEVKNTSGGTLVKGTPVYITGTVGATIRAEVAAADASSSATMPAVGVLAQDLINNEDGFAVTGGFLTNITTDPIDGLTPTENDTVYVKAGGGLTLTKPTGSDLIQNIAKVGKVSGGNAGSLIVSSILRTNDVPNLTTGKIWVGTATNTAESGVVYLDESNGRMGIGLTNPSVEMHVNGFARLNGGLQLNTTNAQVYQIQNSDLRFGTNNTEQMRITASGNVGIGTTTPGYTLTVAKDLGTGGTLAEFRNSNSTYSQNMYLSFNSSKDVTWSQGSSSGGTVINTGTRGLRFEINGSEKVRVDSNGNVGIGTTAPAQLLHLSSSSPKIRLEDSDGINQWAQITQENGALSIVSRNNTTAGVINLQTYNGTTTLNTVTLKAGNQVQFNQYGSGTFTGTATQRLAVDSSGNVIEIPIGSGPVDGSGTANYVTKWSDTDTITDSLLYDDGAQVLIGATSSAFSDDLYINNSAYAQSGWRVGTTTTYVGKLFNNAGVLSLEADQTRSINFRNTANGEIVRIDGINSRVGIGTTSPIYKLDVNSGNVNQVASFSSTDGNAHIELKDSLGSSFWNRTNARTSIGSVIGDSASNLNILDTGNVGIGTTSPGAKLHVDAGIADFKVQDAFNGGFNGAQITGTNAALGFIGGNLDEYILTALNDGSFRVYNPGGAGYSLTLTNTGRLGIGKTSPAYTLHIGTGIIGSDATSLSNNTPRKVDLLNANTTGMNAFTSYSSNTNVLPDFLGKYGYKFEGGIANANKQFQVYVSDAVSPKMIVNGTGNVGIGTTSPSQKLHVDGITYSTSGYKLNNGFSIGALGYNSALRFNNGNILVNNSSSAEFVRFDASNSRVGIGTTSPAHALHVNGVAYVVSGLFGVNGGDRIQISNRANNDVAVESFSAELFLSSGFNGISFEGSSNTTLMKLTDSGELGIGTTTPAAKLDVNGGVRIADDAAIASATNVGTLRYRTSGNNSYVDMCMQTGATTYAWVNIVQNNW